MSERELVKKILKGNKKAIREFYEAYEKRLLNFILRKVDNKKDAEEILQDTFISALDSLPLFKGQSSLLTWLCAISRHEIADFYRRKKLKTIIFSRLPFLKKIVDRALGPELALQEKEAKEKIYKTFKNLSEGYSQILRLKYIEGLTMAQIAFKLGKTVKAVESKLSRARLSFQNEYKKQYSNLNSLYSIPEKSRKVLNSSGNQRELSF